MTSPRGLPGLIDQVDGPDGEAAALECRHLARKISGRREIWALKDVSLTIRSGEFVAIVGPSGSGKTTLLSLLGLLDRPTSGTYAIGGVPTGTLSERDLNAVRGERLGFIFQNSFVVGEQSVGDNVALGLRVQGVGASERQRRVRAALKKVGLGDAIGKPAGDLSGGEKQRVAVARALVTNPQVILADEPTGSLDQDSSIRLVELLRSINETGTTVVVVTHDPIVAAAADRRIELVDGVVQGEPADPPSVPAAAPSLPHGRAGRRHSRSAGRRRRRQLVGEVSDALVAPLWRPIRSGLVLLAYVLGVAALVGAIGLTQSTTAQVVDRLAQAGSVRLRVANDSLPPGDPFYDPASPHNAAAKVTALRGVKRASVVQSFGSEANQITRLAGGTPLAFTGRMVVCDQTFLASYGLHASSGRVELIANTWHGSVAILGAAAAKKLAIPDAGPGRVLFINARPVDTGAVLAASGDPTIDNTIYLSPGVIPYLTNRTESYLEVQAETGFGEPLARALPSALSPTNPGSITVSTVAQLSQLQSGIDSDLARLLNVIGWVILVLSALTAGTSMFLSIQHRAPEIALRRAVGSTRTAIWRLFTYEGLVIGFAGGAIGTFLGAILTWALARAQGWPPSLGLSIIPIGLGVGIATGAIASAYPAFYAARRDPAPILRQA